MADKPKIVLFDIETIPNFTEIMKIYPKIGNYPGLTLKASIGSIICFGYKIYGQKKVNCINAWDYKPWKKDINDDKILVKKIYDLLKDADCVVTHNGKQFDWKYIQTRLAIHGLPMLPNIKHVDTRLLAKKLFMFNNSLDIIAKAITKEKKMDNGGWELWVNVYSRQKKAMKLMSEYCKQDVITLEAIFERLKPLSKDIPNYNLFRRDGAHCCPNCGGFGIRSLGYKYTATTKKKRYICLTCGTAHTDSNSLPRV